MWRLVFLKFFPCPSLLSLLILTTCSGLTLVAVGSVFAVTRTLIAGTGSGDLALYGDLDLRGDVEVREALYENGRDRGAGRGTGRGTGAGRGAGKDAGTSRCARAGKDADGRSGTTTELANPVLRTVKL